MSKDPAFLFYPGDASEDTQFMNRLERGCYFDILKAQKKFRRFSMDLIRKVLGQDFTTCWPAIEPVLKKDDEGYFIEWADDSIERRAEFAEKQKKRIKDYWDKKKVGNTTEPPRTNHSNSLENEIGNGNAIEDENEKRKRGVGENQNVSRETINFYNPDVEGDEVVFPLDTKPVRELWANWKKSRWDNHRIRYPTMGEQSDLKRLEGMAFNQIQQTILAAIGAGWKNLYPERGQNGKANGAINKKQQHTDSVKQSVASHYENVFAKGRGKPNGPGADGQ